MSNLKTSLGAMQGMFTIFWLRMNIIFGWSLKSTPRPGRKLEHTKVIERDGRTIWQFPICALQYEREETLVTVRFPLSADATKLMPALQRAPNFLLLVTHRHSRSRRDEEQICWVEGGAAPCLVGRCVDRPTGKISLKKEGRDAEGRMGGGDDEQERRTAAVAVGQCVREAQAQSPDSNIQVLTDGSLPTFTTSFSYKSLSAIKYFTLPSLHFYHLLSAYHLILFFPLLPLSVPSPSSLKLSQISLLLLFLFLLLLLFSPFRGKLSASVGFYLCNLHPLWQPSVPPSPSTTPWLFTAARPS